MKNTNTKRGMRSNFTLKLSSAEDEIEKTRQTPKAFHYIKDNTIHSPVFSNNYNDKEKSLIQIL